MNYLINVALHGDHFFATSPHSCTTLQKAVKVLDKIREKFPKSEGYEIMVSYERTVGRVNRDITDAQNSSQILENLSK